MPFKFLVGPSAKEYFIHRGLVASLSGPLNALVNGGMRESHEGCVIWDDVDEDVFQRFAQFAYTGSYVDYEPTGLAGPPATSPSAAEATKITAKVMEKLLSQMSPKPSQPRQLVPSSASAANNAPAVSDDGFGPTVQYCCMSEETIAALDAAAEAAKKSAASSSQEPAGNEKKEAFKLPYSLSTYRRAATEWLAGRSNHSRNCKQRFAVPRFTPRPAKRKFESMTCDCDLGSEGTPSEKKRDFISAFMAKADVMPPHRTLWATVAAQPARRARALREPSRLDFEPVFVGHARMWVFADRYQVPSLMDHACAQLVRELAEWTLGPATFVPQFGGLVRYVYDDHTMVGCQLRLLVAQFAACVVEDVEALDEWPAVVNDVPDFAVDLMRQMTNRFG